MATENLLFGRGLLRPFQRDGKGDFANADGMAVLRSDIGELLGIIGPSAISPGEIPWAMDRGSRMHALKHRFVHKEMQQGEAQQYTGDAIRAHEHRVRVGRTTVSGEDETLTVRVQVLPIGYPIDKGITVEIPVR